MSQPGDPTQPATADQPSAVGSRDWIRPPVVAAPARPGTTAIMMTAVVVGISVLGGLLGVVWAVVAPDVPVLVTQRGPVYAAPQPEQLIAADGWFAILSLPFGVLVAVGGWLAARRIRGVPGLLSVILGAVGAAVVAWLVGRQIGLADYQQTLAAAHPGAELSRPPDLESVEVGWWPPRLLGVLLVPALVAAAGYTMLAAWSRFPTLRAEPPHGPQSPSSL